MKIYTLVLVLTSAAWVVASPAPPCPADGTAIVFFADDDCSKYWECANGIGYQFTCPSNLNWNPESLTCDYANRAGCTGFGWSTTTTRRPSPTTNTPPRTTNTPTRTTPTTTAQTTTTPTTTAAPITTRRTTLTTTPSTTPSTTPTPTPTTVKPKPTTRVPEPTTEAPGDDCRWWWWWAPWKCRRE
uniref:Chitin-binding type-2 domain-containing protein n=1 Tax=Dendroctonus ponderosae TaxID=77166 RepID=A0AAR5Q034_DENPD